MLLWDSTGGVLVTQIIQEFGPCYDSGWQSSAKGLGIAYIIPCLSVSTSLVIHFMPNLDEKFAKRSVMTGLMTVWVSLIAENYVSPSSVQWWVDGGTYFSKILGPLSASTRPYSLLRRDMS